MGSPAIFQGNYTRLLTSRGILNSNGGVNTFDGARNYINNAQFENGTTTGWSLFNTTLTAGLPTGAVGAGAASLAMTTTTTNPLMLTTSLQVAAASAWTAGQGVISDAFTIDRGDIGDAISFEFYYECTAGSANANWSGVQGSQTLATYIYDVTASAWVQPSNFLSMNYSTGASYIAGQFKCSTTVGQQYRIAVIALQATTLPLTMVFDAFMVSPVVTTEFIAASYYCSANVTASTTQPINFDTKIEDTHNAVTTSPTAWQFKAPAGGLYQVSTYNYGSNPGTSVNFQIYKNGTAVKVLNYQPSGQNSSGVTFVRLNANDLIDVRPNSSRTVTGGVLTNENVSYLDITLLGY